ncbi:HAD family hydrolase [Ramlibacter rhizophilus]|uniref:phosphoglycolate phosphatase n=1 Tax=Ramlibacter rhizophilus TaxID=1781167 RepID=A0A4Z0C3Z8_9BURK|nr:HAD family hydrolase [Ramlibacter rhizophilus]TFZ04919.1 HAD family hydrolase [Ramlibacter rhizophilus]
MVDWGRIDLVVFDVDGTLYAQQRLRRAMLLQLLADAVRCRSLRTLRLLRTFRHVREALGDEEATEFLALQYQRTGERLGCEPAHVRAVTEDWMERRPLPLLAACRYAHVDRLFAGLRLSGKRIAIFSDHPARAKVEALGLHADIVVSATDADVARLKPDPAGLHKVLAEAGVPATRALMVGDRMDRDAAAAHRAGMLALIRSRKPLAGVQTFRRYDDPVFQPVLAPAPAFAPQVAR